MILLHDNKTAKVSLSACALEFTTNEKGCPKNHKKTSQVSLSSISCTFLIRFCVVYPFTRCYHWLVSLPQDWCLHLFMLLLFLRFPAMHCNLTNILCVEEEVNSGTSHIHSKYTTTKARRDIIISQKGWWCSLLFDDDKNYTHLRIYDERAI